VEKLRNSPSPYNSDVIGAGHRRANKSSPFQWHRFCPNSKRQPDSTHQPNRVLLSSPEILNNVVPCRLLFSLFFFYKPELFWIDLYMFYHQYAYKALYLGAVYSTKARILGLVFLIQSLVSTKCGQYEQKKEKTQHIISPQVHLLSSLSSQVLTLHLMKNGVILTGLGPNMPFVKN